MTDTSSEPDIDSPDLVHWSPKRGPSLGSSFRLPAGSYSALAVVTVAATLTGAITVGALAIGALAIGRMAVGRADLREVRIGKLVVDELVVFKRSNRAD